MEYFSESSSQYYVTETEFWQHPYRVECPGLVEPYLPTGAYASLYDPMQQTAANFPEHPAMEPTTACVFPSANSELMQLVESNVRVTADTANDSWMKELNAVEELLCQKSSKTEYIVDVNSSSMINELQQIIEGSSFESPSDGSTGANIPIQDVAWNQASEIMAESDCWRANGDLQRYSPVAPTTDIGSSEEAIHGTYYEKCKCKMVKRRRRKRLPSLNFASLIDNELLSVGDKASYMNKRLKRVSKQGWITREGIQCGCCSKVYNISMFEAHAGSRNHRPAANIFLDDGRCLMDLQLGMLQNQRVKNSSQQQDSSEGITQRVL